MTKQNADGLDPENLESARYIPYLFLLAFVIVFAANGVMIVTAMDSFPGFSREYQEVHHLKADK